MDPDFHGEGGHDYSSCWHLSPLHTGREGESVPWCGLCIDIAGDHDDPLGVLCEAHRLDTWPFTALSEKARRACGTRRACGHGTWEGRVRMSPLFLLDSEAALSTWLWSRGRYLQEGELLGGPALVTDWGLWCSVWVLSSEELLSSFAVHASRSPAAIYQVSRIGWAR